MTVPSPYGESAAAAPSLAERYLGPEPVEWYGTEIYPMYSVPLGDHSAAVSLTLRAAAPPEGLLGLGMGLSMLDGHVELDGRRLAGVDVWTDAMAAGIELSLRGTGPEASFTFTPVWMTADGVIESWTGNYGVLVESAPDGHTVLHCSTGVGAPDFAELVVAVTTVPTFTMPMDSAAPDESRYGSALYDLGVAMQRRGEVDQACVLWVQAAGLGHAGAAYDLGVVRFRRGRLGEAEHWWRAAADHGDVRAMAGLAAVLDRQGKASEAQEWRAWANGWRLP
jgi:hypothetical protein